MHWIRAEEVAGLARAASIVIRGFEDAIGGSWCGGGGGDGGANVIMVLA